MKNTLTYKGYFGSVEYCDADNVLHGKLIGINDSVTYHGDGVKSLKKSFIEAVDDYLEICAEMGKEPEKAYKGTFNVRIEPALHRQLVIYSTSHGKSLNATVEEAISSLVS